MNKSINTILSELDNRKEFYEWFCEHSSDEATEKWLEGKEDNWECVEYI